jgi:putative FmdB family regulatory protein
MPTYAYRCDGCGEEFDKVLPISRYKEPQDCINCGEGPARKMITGGTGFILKGDSWAGKNLKVKSQMREKNRRLDSKQNEMKRDAPSVTLTPNVAGEQVGSWSEASKLAKSKGKNTSGYDRLARKEKKQ